MGLAPGEQRTLTEIESQLHRTDPNLAATFALFASQDLRRRGPLGRFLTSWTMRHRRAIRITVLALVAALAACLAVCIYLACHHVGAHVPGSGTPPFPRLLIFNCWRLPG
jgi:hypothetical protein